MFGRKTQVDKPWIQLSWANLGVRKGVVKINTDCTSVVSVTALSPVWQLKITVPTFRRSALPCQREGLEIEPVAMSVQMHSWHQGVQALTCYTHIWSQLKVSENRKTLLDLQLWARVGFPPYKWKTVMWDTSCVSLSVYVCTAPNKLQCQFTLRKGGKTQNNPTKVFCTSTQPQPGSAMAVLEHKSQRVKQTLQGTKMGAVLTQITEGKSLLVDIFLLYFLLHIVPRSHCDRSIRNA